MDNSSSQSYSIPKIACLVGTASLFSFGMLHNSEPINSFDKNFSFEQKQEEKPYYLQHEIMPQILKKMETEPIIEIPTFKTIEVTYNKPTRLQFTSVENNQGFLG